jgi:hypothetical protein
LLKILCKLALRGLVRILCQEVPTKEIKNFFINYLTLLLVLLGSEEVRKQKHLLTSRRTQVQRQASFLDLKKRLTQKIFNKKHLNTIIIKPNFLD